LVTYFQISIRIVDAVARLLIIAVNVCGERRKTMNIKDPVLYSNVVTTYEQTILLLPWEIASIQSTKIKEKV